MPHYPTQRQWAEDELIAAGTFAILVTGTELVNALDPERNRVSPKVRAALDAFRDAMEGRG